MTTSQPQTKPAFFGSATFFETCAAALTSKTASWLALGGSLLMTGSYLFGSTLFAPWMVPALLAFNGARLGAAYLSGKLDAMNGFTSAAMFGVSLLALMGNIHFAVLPIIAAVNTLTAAARFMARPDFFSFSSMVTSALSSIVSADINLNHGQLHGVLKDASFISPAAAATPDNGNLPGDNYTVTTNDHGGKIEQWDNAQGQHVTRTTTEAGGVTTIQTVTEGVGSTPGSTVIAVVNNNDTPVVTGVNGVPVTIPPDGVFNYGPAPSGVGNEGKVCDADGNLVGIVRVSPDNVTSVVSVVDGGLSSITFNGSSEPITVGVGGANVTIPPGGRFEYAPYHGDNPNIASAGTVYGPNGKAIAQVSGMKDGTTVVLDNQNGKPVLTTYDEKGNIVSKRTDISTIMNNWPRMPTGPG